MSMISKSTPSEVQNVVIFHSPDADDAFMFYGLQSGAVQVPGFSFTHELRDIESLNRLALQGAVDCTAVSVHAFGHLGSQYAMLTCGASMGGAEYGPRLVAPKPCALNDGRIRRFALPGAYTSATLALKIYLKEAGIEAELIQMGFDAVLQAVKNGEVDCGLIIHEGQITHQKEGLTTVLDLGVWWWKKTGLPLPLGINVVKRSLGLDAMRATQSALKASIEYSLAHRAEALDYALSYGRGLERSEADTFVGMYVNERTLDLGEEGVKSIRLFLELGAQYGYVPSTVEALFVE